MSAMTIDYRHLPVYEQKQHILDMLESNQVIVVQSPTGSGKTTQLPVILHEAGYSEHGMIAVTQPRRIAALSVSEFIARQLGTTYPGTVGYKMRFEDKTDASTKIKIMTDGILLQEMKLDPWMSKYSVVMVDEAHERSLNIDFVLGLLKRILAERKDFKVIVSSATMNTELFAHYFDDCPIVSINTVTYPVTVVYDPPSVPASASNDAASDALLSKIEGTVERILANNDPGASLIFLPGEKIIKDCMYRLSHAHYGRKLQLIPLYGRLAKEEQERVFDSPSFGRKKIVISTNIAETSVTIPDVTSVIDSGLAKLNYYSPKTFTSSLNETAVSKASCNQRKGRAGRTQSGTCYRLYPRSDFDSRPLYTTEEIYRTDLSEVVLRMAELGITDFEQFDFISPPNREGLKGAIETLTMLGALNGDYTLSDIGKLMVRFPLLPRQSRIIVESLLTYPEVIEQVLIASSFLSAQTPFILPQGEETDARKAHHSFRDARGDFVSYLKIFSQYSEAKDEVKFCKKSYLDDRVMAEIANIKVQLEQIVSDLGFPVLSSGSVDDYLCCIATGMIQFVCVRERKEQYKSLTAEHIQIHPGSSMFRTDPYFIVAGEIVRTSRMFAMSVSPLSKGILQRIDPLLEKQLTGEVKAPRASSRAASDEKQKKGKGGKTPDVNENSAVIGGVPFEITRVKGKKLLVLPWDKFKSAYKAECAKESERGSAYLAQLGGIKAKVVIKIGKQLYDFMAGEKFELIGKIVSHLDITPIDQNKWPRKLNINVADNADVLIGALDLVLRVTVAKVQSHELGFITLFTDGSGTYWFKVSRGFSTALNESLSSIEKLIDDASLVLSDAQKATVNAVYRVLNGLYE